MLYTSRVSGASHMPIADGVRRSATIPRPRVAALFAAAGQRRVTLVTAGAGYGKTTAIAASGTRRQITQHFAIDTEPTSTLPKPSAASVATDSPLLS